MKKKLSKYEEADRVIRHHVYASMGMGLLPIPLADLLGQTVICLRLTKKLAEVYGVPLLKEGESSFSSSFPIILASLADDIFILVANAGLPSFSGRLAASLGKAVPGIGHTAGAVTMPVLSGATTYAVGRVFNQHFASGGTLLTFDPEKMRNYYAEMFKEGELVAKELGTNKGRGKGLKA